MVSAYNLWPFFGYYFYDVGMSIGLMLLIWSIHLSAQGVYRSFTLGFTLMSVSNVVDELFFDPTSINVSEYIAAVIILILVLRSYVTQRNK